MSPPSSLAELRGKYLRKSFSARVYCTRLGQIFNGCGSLSAMCMGKIARMEWPRGGRRCQQSLTTLSPTNIRRHNVKKKKESCRRGNMHNFKKKKRK